MQVPKIFHVEFEVNFYSGQEKFSDKNDIIIHFLESEDLEFEDFVISKIKDFYKNEHNIFLDEVNIVSIRDK